MKQKNLFVIISIVTLFFGVNTAVGGTSQTRTLNAKELSFFLSNQLSGLIASGPAEIKKEEYSLRVIRTYKGESGVWAWVSIDTGSKARERYNSRTKPEKTTIHNYNAICNFGANNAVALFVDLAPEIIVWTVVFNTENRNLALDIIDDIDLNSISNLSNNNYIKKQDNDVSFNKKVIKVTDFEYKKILPEFHVELNGANEIRINNPNGFSVAVGIRSGNQGRNLLVLPNDVSSVYIPNGTYQIFFVYSNNPEALFRGDDFNLNNNGVEIKIVKVVGGNYGIKRVK